MMREWRVHALSVFSLAVAFVCLGAALLVVTNLRAAEQRWSRAGRASGYLKDAASPEDVQALRAALARVPGVTAVHYVSCGHARVSCARELEVAQEMSDADLADMVGKMKLLPAVDDVETYQSWTEKLGKLVRGGLAA